MKGLFIGSAALLGAVASAAAADLPVASPPPPVFSWTGFYIGANAGAKWGTTSGSVVIAPSAAGGLPTSATLPLGAATTSTVIGGGQVGYNYQIGHFVVGVEGDIDAQNLHRTRTQTTFATGTIFVPGDAFSVNSRWQASLRARAGYAWDRLLIYATGGVAFTNVKVGTTFVFFAPDPATSASSSATLVGATVGGGFEYAFWNNVSLGLEGRYTWYGSHTFDAGTLALAAPPVFTPASQRIRLDTAELLGKINWRF